jgi:hypothetical protein
MKKEYFKLLAFGFLALRDVCNSVKSAVTVTLIFVSLRESQFTISGSFLDFLLLFYYSSLRMKSFDVRKIRVNSGIFKQVFLSIRNTKKIENPGVF